MKKILVSLLIVGLCGIGRAEAIAEEVHPQQVSGDLESAGIGKQIKTDIGSRDGNWDAQGPAGRLGHVQHTIADLCRGCESAGHIEEIELSDYLQ
jgi:hypothetical protein